MGGLIHRDDKVSNNNEKGIPKDARCRDTRMHSSCAIGTTNLLSFVNYDVRCYCKVTIHKTISASVRHAMNCTSDYQRITLENVRFPYTIVRFYCSDQPKRFLHIKNIYRYLHLSLPRSGVILRFICPCKNSIFKTHSAASRLAEFQITGKMKIRLNVRVNLTSEGKVFTVWARQHRYLPGIEFYTGSGISTSDAVEDLFSKLPDEFTIDDEYSVRTTSLEHTLQIPFDIVRSDSIRPFILH